MDLASSDPRSVTLTGRAFQCADREAAANQPPPPPPPQAAPPNAPPPSPPAASATPEERLAKLKELLDKKMITQEEYDKRRAEILGSI